MNTYIQDKLDAIENDLKEKGYTKFERETIIDIAKQSFTDYHNHIVEKIRNEKLTDEREAKFEDDPDNKLSDGYFIGYNQSIADILKSLQDTNSKE